MCASKGSMIQMHYFVINLARIRLRSCACVGRLGYHIGKDTCT